MQPAVTFDAWHSASYRAHSRPQQCLFLKYSRYPLTTHTNMYRCDWCTNSWECASHLPELLPLGSSLHPELNSQEPPPSSQGKNTADFLCKASISSHTVCLSLVRWSVPLQADFREPASHVSSWKGSSLRWKLMLPSQSCASLATDHILYYLYEKNINWYAYNKTPLY